MSHSEKVCRVGSMALAPIVVVLIGGAVFGAVGGLVWLLVTLFPSDPTAPVIHHSQIPVIVALSLMGSVMVAVIASQVYPWLYAHCRGSEFLAQVEVLDREHEAISGEFYAKLENINKRKAELMTSSRAESIATSR